MAFLDGSYAAMVGALLALIAVFATASRLGPQVTRGLNGIAAVALLVLGVYQVWSGDVG